jgi:hypothetical protein
LKLLVEPKLSRERRVYKLAERLDVSPVTAWGHVLLVMGGTLEFHEDGRLVDASASDIARYGGWVGDPETFLAALKDVGWLVSSPELAFADWHELQGALIEKRAREREKKRKQRARRQRKLSPGTSPQLSPPLSPSLSPAAKGGRPRAGDGREGTGREGTGEDGKDLHHVPDELKALSLFAANRKLCDRWHILLPDWKLAYPGVNVMAELHRAHSWEQCNPTRQKVDKVRFLNSWLARSQDQHGGRDGSGNSAASGANGTRSPAARPTSRLATDPVSHSIGSKISTFFKGPGEERGGPSA